MVNYDLDQDEMMMSFLFCSWDDSFHEWMSSKSRVFTIEPLGNTSEERYTADIRHAYSSDVGNIGTQKQLK